MPWMSSNMRTGSGRDGFDHEQVTDDCGENGIYVEMEEGAKLQSRGETL